MVTIDISDFRAKMNAVLQRVQRGEIVVITSRGIAIAHLVPPDYALLMARKELEALRETAVLGDVLAPLDEHWKANE